MPLNALLERLGVRPLVIVALPRRDRLLSKPPRKPHLNRRKIGMRQDLAELGEQPGVLPIPPLPLALGSRL